MRGLRIRAVAGIKADWRGEGPQGRVGRQNGEEAGKKDIAFGGLGSRWGLLTGGGLDMRVARPRVPTRIFWKKA